MTAGELATAADIAALRSELREVHDLLGEIRQALPPRMISVAEAAKALAVDPQTIRAMCKRGDLAHRRAGRRLVIEVGALRARESRG